MNFEPFPRKIEIEPIHEEEIILSDGKRYEQMGKVIRCGDGVTFVKPGDVVFFLAQGIEQTPKYDGVEHYVVPCDYEFIIGKCTEHSQDAAMDTSTPTESKPNFQMESGSDAGGVSEHDSSTTEPPTTSI